MPRQLLFALAALAALLVLAVAALLAFVDVDAFRPQIEQAASQRLGRALSIDGPLKLTVVPRLAIELPRTRLAESDSPKEFARVEGARIGVSLLPLLAGRFEADSLRVVGLVATIERRADGSTSVDDLLGVKDAGAAGATGRPRAAPQLAFRSIEIAGARLTLLDGGRKVLALSKLNVDAGPLAAATPLPIRLTADFEVPDAAIAGQLTTTTTLHLDAAANRHHATPLQVNLKGRHDGNHFEVQLAAPRFEFGPAMRADTLTVAARFGGEQPVAAQIEIKGINGDARRLAAATLSVDAELRQAARRIVVHLAGPASAEVQARTLKLPKLAGTASIDDPALRGAALKAAFSGSGAVDAGKQTAELTLDIRVDESTLRAQVGVADFARPRLRFDLDANRLDFDRYLPPRPRAAAAPAAEAAPIDLSPLRELRLAGEARVGELRAGGLRASEVRLALRSESGRLEVSRLSARLYGGTLAASGFAAVADHRFGLNADLDGVAVEPLLRDLLQADPLSGTGSVNLRLTTQATTLEQARRALAGTAALRLRDGAIKGLDLLRQMQGAADLLRAGRDRSQPADSAQRTDFTEMTASFVIRDGVARSEDLDARSALLRVTGSGLIDLGAGRIDCTARVAVVGRLRGLEGGHLDQLLGLTVPVRLSGPFDQLNYEIRWAAVARETLKSTAGDVLDRVVPGAREPGRPREQRLRDLLKGLPRP